MNTPEINDGGPAFPCPTGSDGGVAFSGMSLRDWFAGQALAGLIARGSFPVKINELEMGLPQAAFILADNMIEERNKK